MINPERVGRHAREFFDDLWRKGDPWRMRQRELAVTYLDLKTSRLPDATYDIITAMDVFITAMDVFEHLVDPAATSEDLWRALKPGGYLFGRFGAQPDADHPMHIVDDFEPVFRRLRELGCIETWRDRWLWGHHVFQKADGRLMGQFLGGVKDGLG